MLAVTTHNLAKAMGKLLLKAAVSIKARVLVQQHREGKRWNILRLLKATSL
jgi:glucose-6-phosphate-specific signal transduction histidine kinase